MDGTINDIWHVFSDGTRADIPFDTDEDKVFGWNSVAICAEIAGVRVWVVTVNDTHFHSLVKGSEVKAEHYRLLLQQRLQRHFPDDNVHVACKPVVIREKVLSRFMYAYRNCMDFYRKSTPGVAATFIFRRNDISSRDARLAPFQDGNSTGCSGRIILFRPIGRLMSRGVSCQRLSWTMRRSNGSSKAPGPSSLSSMSA